MADPTTMNVDKISNLPDSLICHILSFLPTINAAATSALSRKWRHLWKDLLVLDISQNTFDYNYRCRELSPSDLHPRFVSFVDAVLDQHRVSPIRFRLSCDITDRNTVTNWIHPIIGPHLHELHLDLNYHNEVFQLPSVFDYRSLVSLTLKGKFYLNHISRVHLPSLKTLELDVATVNPIGKLLSGSPVLETLNLTLNVFKFDALRSVNRSTIRYRSRVVEDLEIDKPSLKCLHICMISFASTPEWCLRLLVSNFPSIMESQLFIRQNEVHVAWMPKLMRALCKTKSLMLSFTTTECLLRAPTLGIPEFCNLLYLKLHLPYFNSRFLMVLLHNSHMLQVLKIDNHNPMGIFFGGWSQHTTYPRGWTQPTSAPTCVTSRLNILELHEYEDSDEERAFAEYILQRGLVLETMIIHTSDYSSEQKAYILKKLSKELSTIPMGSNQCQLKIE